MREATKAEVLIAGLLLLAGAEFCRERLAAAVAEARPALEQIRAEAADTAEGLEQAREQRDMKRKDLERFKAGMSKLTESRRSMYVAGLQLQEEKRQLEKLWEVVSTYLLVDEKTGTVNLMVGDQALITYPVGYAPHKQFGEPSGAFPQLTRVVSKERFAHPERPQSREVDGKLEWLPPQVGGADRAKALGEFVLFTDGPLILHGRPNSAHDHAAYPHACLGLPTAVAQRLYEKTFVGTKILFAAVPKKK